MKASKIVAYHKLSSVSSCSAIICNRLGSTSGVTIRMLQYHPKTTCCSISISHISSSTHAYVTHCLHLSKAHLDGLTTSKSVNVKFEMKIECQFGDHILIVGDDPILGSWSPLKALPFNWSEGHLWTLLLELPVDKSFKYKFLLKRSSGEILWQPGPDRIFRSWETENLIVVGEEWETAEAQQISEQLITRKNDEEVIIKPLIDDSVPMVAENITVSISDENSDSVEDCSETLNRSKSGPNAETGAHSKEISPDSKTSKTETSSDKNSQRKITARKSSSRSLRAEKSSPDEVEGSLVTIDEGPVLVPGLTVILNDSEKDHVNEHQSSILADSEPNVQASLNQEYIVYRFD